MHLFQFSFILPLLAALALTGPAYAQSAGQPQAGTSQPPIGDGLRGAYYTGRNFEHFVTARRDAVIDFNWHREPPLAGVPAEDFSVRWTGWLLPPTTGEYVVRVLVDDGARLWLDNKQLVNEWRGQEPTLFQVKVQLRAGHAYRLRLDYSQYGWDTRALLSWRPPAATAAPNPLGLPDGGAPTTAIPTRYLFSHNPVPPPAAPLTTPGPPRPMPTVPLAPVAVRSGAVAAPALAARRARPQLAPVRQPRPLRPTRPAPDTARAAALAARLASGQALTLRALYFEQGRADLLPAVQASLDTLAQALRRRPALRLQVQGHTDNQGDSVLNRQLSQRRAEAVCYYLSAHGIAAARLRPVGLGGRYPVADNRLPAERPRNRRVVLIGF